MNFFDFNNFFNWSRLVEPIPSGDWRFIWWALAISVGLILLAIVRTLWPGDIVLKHKTEACLWLIGTSGLLLTFFRWQEIPYLAARIFWLILALTSLFWFVLIIYYRQITLPKIKLKLKAEARRKKYL